MKDQNSSKKRNQQLFSGFLGTILIVSLITVAFGLLIYGMYMFDIVSIIDLSAIIDKNNSNEGINRDNIYEELRDGADMSDFVYMYSVTPEELTAIISDLKAPESYTIRSEAVYCGTDTDRTIITISEKMPNSYIVEKHNGEHRLYETIKLEGNTVTVTDNIRNRFSKYPNTKEFTFEAVAGIPSISLVTDVCTSIIGNINTDVTDYEISLVARSSDTYYRVSFTYADLDQTEEYYISGKTGMIVNQYTYIDDTLNYRYILHEFQES